jgi:hypothetical protein
MQGDESENDSDRIGEGGGGNTSQRSRSRSMFSRSRSRSVLSRSRSLSPDRRSKSRSSNESEEENRNHGDETVGDQNHNVVLTDAEIKKLAAEIAKNLVINEAQEKAEKKLIGETWIAGDLYLHCRPCAKFSRSPLVPQKLHINRRGEFGFVNKEQPNNKIKHAIARHEKINLHIWCSTKERELEREAKENEERDEKCGELVVRNVLHCLKHGYSANGFVALNNLNHLTPGFPTAVKNNSRRAFFEIRELIFEVLDEKTKALFGLDGGIENIYVSLDKITVYHVSFTAIVTYFYKG